MLGRHMKANGYTQDVLLGARAVELEWYRNTGELVRGLEKNSYAMIGFSIPKLVALTVAVVVARYWPMVALFTTAGVTWWLNLGSVVATFLIYLVILRITRYSPHCLWWYPVTALVMLYIIWRGVVLTIRGGGINWRGTLYALKDLKAARAAWNTSLRAAAEAKPAASGAGSRPP
jgi:hypothetical protein